MNITFDLGGGLLESLEILEDRVNDIGPPLRRWGAWKRGLVKDLIASGQFAPLAASTLRKRLNTKTGRITKHGTIRASYLKRLDARTKRIKGLIAWAERKNQLHRASIQKKIASWKKQLESLDRQLRKAQESTFSDRSSGKSVADVKGTTPFPKLGTTIRMKVTAKGAQGACAVGSAAGVIGKIHNEGGTAGHGAVEPPRTFLKLTAQDIKEAKRLLVMYGIAPFTEAR